jgi:hypothetical protein
MVNGRNNWKVCPNQHEQTNPRKCQDIIEANKDLFHNIFSAWNNQNKEVKNLISYEFPFGFRKQNPKIVSITNVELLEQYW